MKTQKSFIVFLSIVYLCLATPLTATKTAESFFDCQNHAFRTFLTNMQVEESSKIAACLYLKSYVEDNNQPLSSNSLFNMAFDENMMPHTTTLDCVTKKLNAITKNDTAQLNLLKSYLSSINQQN